jgi:hypothetical protein
MPQLRLGCQAAGLANDMVRRDLRTRWGRVMRNGKVRIACTAAGLRSAC